MRFHRVRIGAVALGLAAGLPGCANVFSMSEAERAGHQSDGTYIPSVAEEQLACRQLRERIDALDSHIATFPERAAREEQSRPRTLGAAFGRMFGGDGGGLKAVEDHKKTTAERAGLAGLYARKDCI
ncbi:hypothetical protein W911_02455 [Hyphomicrobium nitrativorans NL23]|uniref:Twin-arginine translocation pathway signal n=1 Tax=Hyphomicrobium nitrativorans NL23 TaxID=1029756 RepID=V5SIV0_9HYPH|nr:hypothetical protein [Hyphomicrobium nitrativorans]AHB49854.1 hypothetical protein W911_02455 [Hyphomicrobium nitrativorans NL23]